MFDTAAVMGFIPTTDFNRARAFYVDLLSLTLVSEDDFAIEVKSGGTHIRITEVGDLTPHPFTILGWRVDDIVADVRELTAKAETLIRDSAASSGMLWSARFRQATEVLREAGLILKAQRAQQIDRRPRNRTDDC